MKLYHGSIEIVNTPEIRNSNRTLDYGKGFYTTTSRSQAEAWVIRRMKENNLKKGYINVFEFNDNGTDGLNTLTFNEPTDEWIDFVMANRTHKNFTHPYDRVYGPVANDRVYAAFALYEGGILDKQSLKTELKTYKLIDQYLFHTARSLKTIKFINAEEIVL